MSKFTVTVELTGHATIEVEAIDVLEAREIAQAQSFVWSQNVSKIFKNVDRNEPMEEVMPITVADADGDEVWRI